MKSTFAHTARIAQALLLSAALAASFVGNASAMVWQSPYGTLLSDTCVAPNGAYMTFSNQSGPVGASCWFNLAGVPGTFYGTFR